MKYPRRLATLEKNYLNSISRFSRDLNTANITQSAHSLEVQIGYVTMNILNCWSNFVRTYYICCASGALSPSGALITSDLSNGGVKTYNEILGNAINSYRPTAVPKADGSWDSRDEPTWHDSSIIVHLAKKFNFTNLADIDTAFTFGYTAHRNLVVFRNYYGHKNRNTMTKAQNLAPKYFIPSNLKPTEILLSSPLGTSGSLLEVWKTEICDTISYLCS